MKNTIVVTIGRNIGQTPMTAAEWLRFKQDVYFVLAEVGDVIQRPNMTDGPDAVGRWEGVDCEEAAAFVAFIPDRDQFRAIPFLRAICKRYRQDAIGWIVADGTDNLIKPVAGCYGDVTDTGQVIGV